jgi:hypothetical protein
MSKKDFRRLNIWFDDAGMSPARCNRIHSVVNSMLTFCEEDDDYDYEVNYSKKVRGIPNEKVKTNDDDFFGNDAPPQNVEPVDFPDDFFR